MKKKNSKFTRWLMIGIVVLLAVTVVGVGAALLSNVERPDNSTPTPTPGGDEVTPCIHMYPDAPVFFPSTAYSHSVVRTCSECGEKDIQQKDHVWKDGVCQHCKDECWHQTADRSKATYSNARYQVHDKTELCDECGNYVTPTAEAHVFVDGVCKLCDFVCSHHIGNEISVTPGSTGCILNGTCGNCEQTFVNETVPHSYGTDLKCKRCNTVCPHNEENFEYKYTEAEGKGYTWVTCPTCGNSDITDAVEKTLTIWYFGDKENYPEDYHYYVKVAKGMTWRDVLNKNPNVFKLSTATFDGFEYNTLVIKDVVENGGYSIKTGSDGLKGCIFDDSEATSHRVVSLNDIVDFENVTYGWE